MKWLGLGMLLVVVVFGNACSFNRSNVAALSQREDQYYQALHQTLQNNQAELVAGLTTQLEVSRAKDRELLQWQRDLTKIDVLLRVGTETRGGQEALLMEAANADLGSVNQVIALENIDQARLDAINRLYNAVITAVAAVQKNNQAITQYLQSGDAEFALKSLDVGALATSISTLRDLRGQLQGAQAQSATAKAADVTKMQNDIEKARDTLLQGLQATKP